MTKKKEPKITLTPALITQMLAVLLDTIKYFGKDPAALRSISETRTGCAYIPPKGSESDGCAIGRYLSAKERKEFPMDKNCCAVSDLPERLIPKKLQGIPVKFLVRVQGLHDTQDVWNMLQGGLSQRGKRQVRAICKEWFPPSAHAEVVTTLRDYLPVE